MTARLILPICVSRPKGRGLCAVRALRLVPRGEEEGGWIETGDILRMKKTQRLKELTARRVAYLARESGRRFLGGQAI